MTAPDQLAYISSLEKELSESTERLKVKRHEREQGRGRIKDLLDERARLQHQISRLQARQELAMRLDKLTQQIEAKKQEKAAIANRMKASVVDKKKKLDETDDNSDATMIRSKRSIASDGSVQQSLHQFLDSKTEKREENDQRDFKRCESCFSIPETRSVYEGFEFRDRDDVQPRENASQSLLSTGSSASEGASSYCLPFSYSPALRSAKNRNKKLQQQLEQRKQNSAALSSIAPTSNSLQTITSTFSSPNPWGPLEPSPTPPIKMDVSPRLSQGQSAGNGAPTSAWSSDVPSISSTFTPPVSWLSSTSSLNRKNATGGGAGTASVATSSTTFSSISSTFSPPLVWEHSTSQAPKSPGDFLLGNNANKQPPSMLDTLLQNSPLHHQRSYIKSKVQFT